MMDKQLSEKILNYKNAVASKYLPVRSDQISKRVFDMEKYFLSTKIDGQICFIIKKKTSINLVNHNSTPFERQELIDELKNSLKKHEGIYVGEIYYHSDDKRTRTYDLKKEIKDPKSDIRIAVFDLLEHDNEQYNENDWTTKKSLLKSVFSAGKNAFFLNEIELQNKKEIEDEFKLRAEDQNEEGVVVRGENGPVFKIKEYLSFDLVILGYVNGYQNNSSLLKEILVGVKNGKDTFLVIGIVVNGFSVEDREKFSSAFDKIKVESDALEISNSKIPFTMIEPKYVVEIESTDIMNSTSSGVIKRNILRYNKKYILEKSSPSVSLTTPVIIKFRDDKKVNDNDVGINQIERVINLEDDNYKEADKKPSKVLKKEIYVKEVKGLKMVKKFFVWETNIQSDEFPKFVFYKVDYSPSRASKLNRDIKVSNDKKQILSIYKDSIESDIKKGWNKF